MRELVPETDAVSWAPTALIDGRPPESLVARFSGHVTAAVFKRYDIVEELDLKAAVQVLNRTRKASPAGDGTAAAGASPGTGRRETDAVDGL
jgi:hypothetical protein